MTKYKTEKRKANVGERILITNAKFAGGMYENGDVRTVSKLVGDTGLHVKEHARGLYHHEYEVIVGNKPRKSERISALETEVAVLKAEVEALKQASKPTVHNVSINSDSFSITKEIERLANAYPPTKSANERRADVIKRAKSFVGEGFDRWYGNKLHTVEYVVNSDKRTVVALLRWKPDNSVVYKGIAKCDPDDVFNADIGKAIALARALGVEVPVEFVKAVQPTELISGMIYDLYGVKFAADKRTKLFAFTDNVTIADDTDAVYE